MKTSRNALLTAFLAVALLLGCGAWFFSPGASSDYPNRDPVGESFPAVVGQSLEAVETEIPGSFAGKPTVLLIGYLQDAQFDIDRWLMGLLQAGVDAQLAELPTIPALLPSFASGWIDDGMRSGIPREDWGAVVTLYGETARPVAELTGTERGRLARIVVLDAEGTIVWFDDKGYSVRKAMEVAAIVDGLGVDGLGVEGGAGGAVPSG